MKAISAPDDADRAVAACLYRARDRMKSVIESLEMEEADPRVAAVLAQARKLAARIATTIAGIGGD